MTTVKFESEVEVTFMISCSECGKDLEPIHAFYNEFSGNVQFEMAPHMCTEENKRVDIPADATSIARRADE